MYPVCGSVALKAQISVFAPSRAGLISRRFSLLQHPLLINSSASPSWSLQQSWCLCSSLYAYFVSLPVTTTNNHSGCSLKMALLWFFGFSVQAGGSPHYKVTTQSLWSGVLCGWWGDLKAPIACLSCLVPANLCSSEGRGEGRRQVGWGCYSTAVRKPILLPSM